jgi:hypothetical protein
LIAGGVLAFSLNGSVLYDTGRALVNGESIGPHFETLREASAARPWFAIIRETERQDLERNAPGDWIEVERYQQASLLRLQ